MRVARFLPFFSPKHNRDDDNGGDSCRLSTPSFVFALHDAMHAARKAPKRKQKKQQGRDKGGKTRLWPKQKGRVTPVSQKRPQRQRQGNRKQRLQNKKGNKQGAHIDCPEPGQTSLFT